MLESSRFFNPEGWSSHRTGKYKPVYIATIIFTLSEHYILPCIRTFVALNNTSLVSSCNKALTYVYFYSNRLCCII